MDVNAPLHCKSPAQSGNIKYSMKTKNTHFQRQEGHAPKDQADIFLKGGTVLNVYSGELLKVNVALKGERIWYVGPLSYMVGNDTRVLDLKNKV